MGEGRGIYKILHISLLKPKWQKGHPACKKTEWWDAGVSRCRFAYGPADATATHYLLLQ